MKWAVLFCVIFSTCSHSALFAQPRDTIRQRAVMVGSSLTYIWDPQSQGDNPATSHLFQEYTWTKNMAFQWHPRWRTGFNFLNVYTRSGEKGNHSYWLAGIFQQYDFLRFEKWNVFGELGVYKGNYCTCGSADPYKKEGLHYWIVGAGAHYKLGRRFDLDLAWNNYQLFNKVPGKYSYTQYIIGLDYYLFFLK